MNRAVRRKYIQNVQPRRALPEINEEAPPIFLRRPSSLPRHRTKAVNYILRTQKRSEQYFVFLKLSVVLILLLVLSYGAWRLGSSIFWKQPLLVQNLSDPIKYPPASIELHPSTALRIDRKLKTGESLSFIVDYLGFEKQIALSIMDEIAKQKQKGSPVPNIKKGVNVEIGLSSEAKIRDVRLDMDDGNEMVFNKGKRGNWLSKVHKIYGSEDIERVAIGSIETSFAAAAAKANIAYDLVDELVDLFSDQINFHRDFQKGDRFVIIYQDRLNEDGTVASRGPILAAAMTAGGQEMLAIRYVGTDGKGRYFKKDGELIGEAILRYPLTFSRISSYFSDARFHPILRRPRKHNGVDFAAPLGTPVRTVADGRVSVAGSRGDAGTMLTIDHSSRYSTSYLHLQKLAPSMEKGAHVKRGEVIGYVGSTGLSTGPHLHYALFDRGQYVDPLNSKLPTLEELNKGNRIDKKYLERVLFTVNHYLKMDLKNSYWG